MRTTCTLCNETLDGAHHSHCKKCCAMRARKLRAKRGFSNVGKHNRDPEKYKEAHEKNPQKRIARSAVSNAIRSGKLTRPDKCACGNPNPQAHHEDYLKPLEVSWLCVTCHGHFHRKYK